MMKKILLAALSLLLTISILILSTGCVVIIPIDSDSDTSSNNSSINNSGSSGNTDTNSSSSGTSSSGGAYSLETLDYIRYSIEDDLQENLVGYEIEYVECIYISEEYIEELIYNSQSNVYYGYDYADVISNMDGINWTFSVDKNGNTIVTEVQNSSEEIAKMLTKVAIGTGVILVCVVASAAASSVGAVPVACFFAGAAKGAVAGALSGAAVSGAIGGVISGVKEKSWDAALMGGLSAAADGFMWGAITGAITGGLTSKACFTEDTLVKTENGYVPISKVSEGDMVYAYDEATAEYTYCPVLNVMQRNTNEIYNVSMQGTTIKTTATHPFYTTDGWIEAQYLTIDSMVLTNDGFVQVDEITVTESEETPVWNLNVAFNHTYTVTSLDVVVHNSCQSDAKVLRQNLINNGDNVPSYNNAAHHMVASNSTNTYAVKSRNLFNRLGIDINDARNGVFLPTDPAVKSATYHRTLHTDAYFKKVWDIIGNSKTQAEVFDGLAYIKTALLNGTFVP